MRHFTVFSSSEENTEDASFWSQTKSCPSEVLQDYTSFIKKQVNYFVLSPYFASTSRSLALAHLLFRRQHVLFVFGLITGLVRTNIFCFRDESNYSREPEAKRDLWCKGERACGDLYRDDIKCFLFLLYLNKKCVNWSWWIIRYIFNNNIFSRTSLF